MKNLFGSFLLGGLLLVVLVASIFGGLVMFLWNVLMVPLFGLPEIGLIEALGLMLLGRLITGGGITGRGMARGGMFGGGQNRGQGGGFTFTAGPRRRNNDNDDTYITPE